MGGETNGLLQVATLLDAGCIHAVLKEGKRTVTCPGWQLSAAVGIILLVTFFSTTKYNIKRWLGSLLMKHKCMFYWFNLEHYRVHGLRDGIRFMLDFGINHYHWNDLVSACRMFSQQFNPYCSYWVLLLEGCLQLCIVTVPCCIITTP